MNAVKCQAYRRCARSGRHIYKERGKGTRKAKVTENMCKQSGNHMVVGKSPRQEEM